MRSPGRSAAPLWLPLLFATLLLASSKGAQSVSVTPRRIGRELLQLDAPFGLTEVPPIFDVVEEEEVGESPAPEEEVLGGEEEELGVADPIAPESNGLGGKRKLLQLVLDEEEMYGDEVAPAPEPEAEVEEEPVIGSVLPAIPIG